MVVNLSFVWDIFWCGVTAKGWTIKVTFLFQVRPWNKKKTVVAKLYAIFHNATKPGHKKKSLFYVEKFISLNNEKCHSNIFFWIIITFRDSNKIAAQLRPCGTFIAHFASFLDRMSLWQKKTNFRLNNNFNLFGNSLNILKLA